MSAGTAEEPIVTTDDLTGKQTRTQFFVRIGNATKPLDAIEKEKYLLAGWPGAATTG